MSRSGYTDDNDDKLAQEALITGHLSWNMLRRYTHLKPENVLEKLK